MTGKYHVTPSGELKPCKAKQGGCPYGNQPHFDNYEQGVVYLDNQHEKEFGLLAGLQKEIKGLEDRISKLEKAVLPSLEKSGEHLSKDWKEKFLRYDDFQEFARNHAREVVQDKLFEKKNLHNIAYKTWKDLHYENSLKNLHKMSDEDAVAITRENIRPSIITGWIREYNSEYKPKIEQLLITNPELRNATFNIAHRVYQEVTGNKVGFEDFLDMEVDLYRGGNFNFIDDDVFISYSFDKKVAEEFAGKTQGAKIDSIRVKIIDTLGCLQTSGEGEVMVRREQLEKS